MFQFQFASIISISFIIISTISMSVNTLESIAGYPISPKDEEGVQKDNESLQMIESVCITWFTIEYILRLAGKCLQII